MELMQLQVDAFNRTAGEADGYDCPLCNNRGGSLRLDPDGYRTYVACSCEAIRRSLGKAKRSGMEPLLREKTFGNFRRTKPWQEKLQDACKAYLKEPQYWLVICGQSGSGKTHLCSAVCRHLLSEGQQVQYMRWVDAAARLTDLDADWEKRRDEKERYKNAPVLYIDDLLKVGGNGQPSRGALSLAFEILNHRYVQGLQTVISTEFSPNALMELDQALGGRIKEKAGPYLLYVAPDQAKNMRVSTP